MVRVLIGLKNIKYQKLYFDPPAKVIKSPSIE